MNVGLLYDGAPRWSDVEKRSYERALNTPYLVVRDKRSKACTLSSGSLWYSAKDPLGPWASTVQRDYQARQRGAQREATQRQVPRSQPSSRPTSRPTSRPSGARQP